MGNSYTRLGASSNVEEEVLSGEALPCFVLDTHIVTLNGEVKVNDLEVGDLVKTMDNGYQPIRWIGSSRRHAVGKFAPILFRKGVIGNTRDLMVSPQHRILVSGWKAELMFGECEVLTPAKSLLCDDKVIRKTGGIVTYYHILFDNHEIIFSEGAPTESFQPSHKNIHGFGDDTRDEILELFPELNVNADVMYPTARLSLTRKEGELLN